MLAKTPIGQRFYNWVASQPPDLKYKYQSCVECACGRFMVEELNYDKYTVITGHLTRRDQFARPPEAVRDVWNMFDNIACGDGDHTDWTFGALKKRIEEQMPECVG